MVTISSANVAPTGSTCSEGSSRASRADRQSRNWTFKCSGSSSSIPIRTEGPNYITLDPLYRSPFGTNIFMYKTLPMLLALAAVLLLLGCANVANLLLVRSVARRRELALRLSMGAGRWRLVRQLLAESLVLALVGGGVAMLLTGWTAGALCGLHSRPPTYRSPSMVTLTAWCSA